MEANQIEYYTTTLSLPVSMFVKREEIRTLEENFEESIKTDMDLASISIHRGNEESEDSTSEKMGRRTRR